MRSFRKLSLLPPLALAGALAMTAPMAAVAMPAAPYAVPAVAGMAITTAPAVAGMAIATVPAVAGTSTAADYLYQNRHYHYRYRGRYYNRRAYKHGHWSYY